MNLTERLGLRNKSGDTLDQQMFCIPAFKRVLHYPQGITHRTALAASYALLETAMPLTARRYREGGGLVASLIPLTADLFSKDFVGTAFNSGDDLTSSVVMGLAALIVRSGASHLVVNLLQNNFRKPKSNIIPLQFRDIGPVA